ncbi:MAG: heavy-metal-associated domain-containing protein [Desulfatirhabdiaceae bacterium]
MNKQSFTVPNISCGHCVMAIKNELTEIAGIKSVEGDPATKQITVEFDTPVTSEKIIEILQEIGYPAEI